VVDGHHTSTGGRHKGEHGRVAEEKRLERILEEEGQIRAIETQP
jgi:hypothetical protein